jgi:hypothetical protein
LPGRTVAPHVDPKRQATGPPAADRREGVRCDVMDGIIRALPQDASQQHAASKFDCYRDRFTPPIIDRKPPPWPP